MTRRDPPTFHFSEGEYEHVIGDLTCEHGWCSGGPDTRFGFPHPCEDDTCIGLVHADFGDENGDGDYWLYTKCDRGVVWIGVKTLVEELT